MLRLHIRDNDTHSSTCFQRFFAFSFFFSMCQVHSNARHHCLRYFISYIVQLNSLNQNNNQLSILCNVIFPAWHYTEFKQFKKEFSAQMNWLRFRVKNVLLKIINFIGYCINGFNFIFYFKKKKKLFPIDQ